MHALSIRTSTILAVVALMPVFASPMLAQDNAILEARRPIGAGASLWAEELTWMEIRDLVRAGTTTIIIGTGGVEQNGPYTAGGKHNFVLQAVLPYIARAIPKSLIAPIVKFVPEGDIEPKPNGHMAFSGTISVEQSTFEALLNDICRSYAAHGFTDIILVGDSGGNQTGMRAVADTLNRKWTTAGSAARVHYLPEYYWEDQWSYAYLKSMGITQIDKTPGAPADAPGHTRNGIHDDFHYEALIAVVDPELIRADQRAEAGLLEIHGVSLVPMSRTIEIGRKLAAYRADITAKAFRASQERLRGKNAP